MPDAPAPSPAPARLVSLDALRGFDMFWILGSGGLFKALRAFGPVQPAAALTDQLEHVHWEGFHFEDLIFPLFVFIAGVSLVFALPRVVEREGRARAARRVAVRALMLFALGLLYYGGLASGLDGVRWGGVLQRIALAYLGAGLLFLWLKPRGLALACGAILAGYAALLLWVPVPEVSVAAVVDGKKVFVVSADHFASGAGRFTEGQNVSDYADRLYLPGRRISGDHDPEGLLSNLPAVASCLLGVGAGFLLRRDSPGARKALLLAAAGAVLVLAGWAWSPWMPVIKRIWTPSYVLIAGGWSALLLAGFYWIIDVARMGALGAAFRVDRHEPDHALRAGQSDRLHEARRALHRRRSAALSQRLGACRRGRFADRAHRPRALRAARTVALPPGNFPAGVEPL